ncbi:hypothetical protein B0H13DRAFT_2358269 [Mycena leptocephala]|nr:hypothetical protein B0H13DRAFT_2358269 [Mycena leptocephala]
MATNTYAERYVGPHLPPAGSDCRFKLEEYTNPAWDGTDSIAEVSFSYDERGSSCPGSISSCPRCSQASLCPLVTFDHTPRSAFLRCLPFATHTCPISVRWVLAHRGPDFSFDANAADSEACLSALSGRAVYPGPSVSPPRPLSALTTPRSPTQPLCAFSLCTLPVTTGAIHSWGPFPPPSPHPLARGVPPLQSTLSWPTGEIGGAPNSARRCWCAVQGECAMVRERGCCECAVRRVCGCETTGKMEGSTGGDHCAGSRLALRGKT